MMVKKCLFFLIVFSIAATLVIFHEFSGWNLSTLQSQISETGFWAPLIYIAIYMLATALILPSTVLNLTGGALFGFGWGITWTSLAAIGSAVLTFWITRLWLRDWARQNLGRHYQILDQEIHKGGISYLFAVRLLPVIPYGVINYSAGLTSVTFYNYLISTVLGTILGLLPFVMLGSSGVKAIATGQMWRIFLPMTLIGLLIMSTTWYQRFKQDENNKN